MAQFTENICSIVVVKVLHYLLETSDMYQHIDDIWLQQMHMSNSEYGIYLYNAHGIYDSVIETNLQQTEADVDKSDGDNLEADNNEASAVNGDTVLDSTATDMQSSTYIFSP